MVVLPGIHADGVAITLANGVLIIVVENTVVKINEGPVVTEHKTVRLEYKKMLAKGIQVSFYLPARRYSKLNQSMTRLRT